MKRKILLIEDEPGLVLGITDLLASEGYIVDSSENGEEGYAVAREKRFDLIILDVMLPDKNGFDVCRDLRQCGITTPILMLTARGQLIDKVLGLKLGADDYLTKPFESLELLARIEARLRNTPVAIASPAEIFQFGEISVNFHRTEVLRSGVPVEISVREYALLRFLIEQRGLTLTRQQLLQEVWGYAPEIETRTVDMHIASLRQKLEPDTRNPRHFLTVRGFGYKFDPVG